MSHEITMFLQLICPYEKSEILFFFVFATHIFSFYFWLCILYNNCTPYVYKCWVFGCLWFLYYILCTFCIIKIFYYKRIKNEFLLVDFIFFVFLIASLDILCIMFTNIHLYIYIFNMYINFLFKIKNFLLIPWFLFYIGIYNSTYIDQNQRSKTI